MFTPREHHNGLMVWSEELQKWIDEGNNVWCQQSYGAETWEVRFRYFPEQTKTFPDERKAISYMTGYLMDKMKHYAS